MNSDIKRQIEELETVARVIARTDSFAKFFLDRFTEIREALSREEESARLPDGCLGEFKEQSGDDWESVTRVFPSTMTHTEIRATYKHPDGYRCECSICMQDGDCCGHWTPCEVYITTVSSVGLKLAKQVWVCNV